MDHTWTTSMKTGLRDHQLDSLRVKIVDFHGRQTKNAGDGTDQQDYVTLRQLQSGLAGITKSAPFPPPATQTVQTLGDRAYSLFRQGTISIQSDCCQRSFVTAAGNAVLIRCDLKQAPIGDDVDIKIYRNAVLWIFLTILDGTTTISATAAEVAGTDAVAVGDYWRIDLTQVGTTFPGSDLTVTIQ